jgi:hypothetical protein
LVGKEDNSAQFYTGIAENFMVATFDEILLNSA